MAQIEEIKQILDEFKNLNSDKFGIISLGIFGSYARGQEKIDSDIDIFISTKTPDPFILVQIKDTIEGLLNKSIDLIRYRENMNPFLKERIERDGIYV